MLPRWAFQLLARYQRWSTVSGILLQGWNCWLPLLHLHHWVRNLLTFPSILYLFPSFIRLLFRQDDCHSSLLPYFFELIHLVFHRWSWLLVSSSCNLWWKLLLCWKRNWQVWACRSTNLSPKVCVQSTWNLSLQMVFLGLRHQYLLPLLRVWWKNRAKLYHWRIKMSSLRNSIN